MALRWIFLTVLAFTLVPGTRAAIVPEQMQAHLRARVEAGECPGIIIGVADASGQVFAAAGRTGMDEGAAEVTEMTLFEIGSITKTFTALLYQMALDGDLVEPEARVRDLVPAGVNLGSKTGGLTLKQLATHQSGLPRMPDNFKPANLRNPYADYSQDQFYAWLRGVQPGAAEFNYSNAGMGLLGHLLVLKTGSDYEALVRGWITGPLGLDNTVATLSEDQRRRSATPHADGAPLPMWDIPTLAGAGALRSTAHDVLRWSALHAGLIEGPLAGAMDRVQNPQARTASGAGKVGLGWMIRPTKQGSIVWHNGGTGGTRSWTGFNRRTQTAVVVLANSSAVVDDIGFHLLDPQVPLRTPRRIVPVTRSVLNRCAGVYSFGKADLTVKAEGNRLSVQLTGQMPNPAYPESDTRYFLRAVDAQFTFEPAENGPMKAVVLHQNGIDQRAERRPE